MAGESPDKSVDEGTPGAAESSAQRDPRVSVFRPRESEDGAVVARKGESGAESEVEAEADAEVDAEVESEADAEAGGRDALREAVAAWVATTEAPEQDASEPSASGSASAPSDKDGPRSAPAEPKPEPKPAAKPEPEPVAKPEPEPEPAAGAGAAAEPKAAAPAADSERTAVFRAVKPGVGGAAKPSAGAGDSASAAEAAPAASAADSERTAVFRAVKPGSGSSAKPSADAEGTASRAAGSGAAAEPKAAAPAADSERTAVFRAVKPGAGGAAKPSAGAGESASAEAKAAPAAAAADSERTAVFRVPKVDTVKPEGGQKSKPTLAKPASASASAPAPAPAPADEDADSERTAVFRAPKPSTFVPLRTDGDGTAEAKPKPKPKTPVPPPPPTPSAPASAATATERLDRSDRSERTTQQPLPPKPPLDMLADLTNNPPPPPSPLRTAVRRFKIYAPLVVLLAVILAVVQLVRPLPEPKLVMTAKSSYTFEGAAPQLPWPTEGQAYMAAAGLGTLGQSGEQKPVPIASVTKSMTAYIILRDHPIKKGEQGAMIDVDKTAETEGKKNDSVNNESTLDTVKEGDKISEYDAIAALMIPSANNIARLLARWDAGSQEAFVKKMNDTAKELGMTNTTYTDPSGLDATTVSTAEDQVKLGLKLVEIETLLDITKKPNWVDPSGKSWRNWNGLTGPSGALGIKTGTTTKAGGNLLFAAQKKIGNTNQLIVGAVLGQHKPSIIDTVLAASKQLMTGTQKALEGATVVKKGDVVGYVDDGLGGRTPVVATADVQAIGWASLTVTVKLADGGGKMPQTAKAGTEVGMLTVGEGASQVKVPVALKSDLASPGIGSKLTRIG
ncbi:D-alanyl-D-alanine carboxypeptidase family protein [Streptomyces yangpuensis]|uniref:D-alanyl-D-alanine carboxypeptidase family protein n=1 Tax=Streptomyces yangpuensis TaxID=1648182 RepID=UPI0036AA7F80